MCFKFAFKASNSAFRPYVERKSIPKFWRYIRKRAIAKSYHR